MRETLALRRDRFSLARFILRVILPPARRIARSNLIWLAWTGAPHTLIYQSASTLLVKSFCNKCTEYRLSLSLSRSLSRKLGG